MPVKECSTDGKPGYKYGDSGTCYTYTAGNAASEKRAKKQAVKQALAIGGGKPPPELSETDLASSGMKKCGQCGFYRSRSQFVNDARTSDGKSKLCIDCRFHSSREFADKPLETVNLDGVDILSAGGPYFGEGSPDEGDSFDESFLKELATANTELAQEIKVPIKVGHSKAQRLLKNSGLYTDEMPAAGWLENFRVSNGKLLTDLRAVPKKLAALIESGGFRTRSVEMKPVKSQTKDGKEYPAVVTALALLGAKAPAVRTLDDVLTAWYSEDEDRPSAAALMMADAEADEDMRTVDYAEGQVIWDSENGANDWNQDLQAVLNVNVDPAGTTGTMDSPASSQPYYVQDIDQINRRAIVCDWRTNTYWVVPFTMSDGDPVPAPQEAWTLAEQAWVEAANDNAAASATDFSEHVVKSAGGRNTSNVPVQNTDKPADVKELSEDQVEGFAKLFGIDETDAAKKRAAVIAKFAEHVPGQSSDVPGSGDTGGAGTPPTPAPAPDVPGSGDTGGAGTPDAGVTLSADEYKSLKEGAEIARSLAESQRSERIDANIALALRQCRIMPESVDKWRSLGERDYDLFIEQLVGQAPQTGLMRSLGSDDKGTGGDDGYGAYAAATGVTVPVREGQS